MPYVWSFEKKEKFRDTWNEELAKIARGERPIKVEEIAVLFETTATSLKHHVKSLNLKKRPNGNTVFREVSAKKLECMKKMWANNRTEWPSNKKERLRQLYCVELLSREDIAEALGVSKSAVIRQLGRMHLKRPDKPIKQKTVSLTKPVKVNKPKAEVSLRMAEPPPIIKVAPAPSFEGCQAVIGRTVQKKIAVRCCVPTLAGKDFCAEHWRKLYAGSLPPVLQCTAAQPA